MPRIEQSRLDGTERQSVMTDEHIILPTSITVDTETGAIYWADTGRDLSDGQIIRYHDNEAVELHVGGSNIHGLSFQGGYLYWSSGDGSGVRRRGGDGVSRDFVSPGAGVHGISTVDVSYHVDSPCENMVHHAIDCSHLCLPNNATHGYCACPDGYIFQKNSVKRCEDSPATFFFSLFSPHSSSPHLLSSYLVSPGNKDTMWEHVSLRQPEFPIVAMATDLISGSIYYISSEDKLIYRRQWNTTTGTIIHDNATLVIGCCLATPEDLAVDWLGRNLYWSDSERGIIEAAKLDGSGRRVISAGLDRPTQIALYPRGVGYVYWIPKHSQSIRRTRMDGTATTSVESLFWMEPNPQENSPFLNLTLNLTASADYRLDRILWSTQIDNQVKVWSLSLASGMRESMPVREPNPELPFTAASVFDGIYFAGAIFTLAYSIDVFELGITSLHVVEDRPLLPGDTVVAMEFAHHTSQPGIHECPYICDGYSPICLVQDHIYGTCKCPPSGFKIIGHDSFSVERESCAEAKSFLMWATPTSIYIYALPSDLSDPKMTSDPQQLPIALNGSVVGLTFDPRERSVVWMDAGSQMIQSVSLDGTTSRPLTQLPVIRPDSMSLDWIGGQLFFTEETGFQIEAVSVRSEGVSGEEVKVGSVMSAYGQEKGVINDLYKPRDILFDSTSTTLYWNGDRREIFKMSLNNIGTRTPLGVAKATRSVAHLSLDEASRWLFWVNEKQGLIEGMSLMDEKIITVAEGAWNISAMTASSITESQTLHTGHLFWVNGTDQFLYHCNTNKTRLEKDYIEKRMDMSQMGGGIVSMVSFDLYRLNFLELPYRCRTTRSCDYLCIEGIASATAECVCPLYREPTGNGKCSDLISCGVHQWSCDDNLECYPFAYFCDGIDHCTNGRDEMNCSYCPDTHLPCGPTSTVCYPNSSRCDQTLDCPSGKDESLCCRDTEFGCYVTDGVYMCLQKQLRCGPEPICMNGEDSENCPSSTPTNTPPPSNPSTSNTNITLIATVATVVLFIALLVLMVVLITTVKCVRSNKKFAPRIPSLTSPTLRSRSDSTSVYSAGISSLGTESTNFGNCSSPHTDSFCKPFGLHTEPSHHISNPPPSLITGRHSDVFEEEMASMVMSDCDPCPAPAPSVNWENMSNMSYSASQRGVPTGNINGRLDHCHHPTGNPLHYHHQRHAGQHNGYSYSNRGGLPLNRPSRMHQYGHLRGRGYDPVETETMFSQSTMNTEDQSVLQFEDRTPPGRPPSPATVTEYSERERPIPLTPTSRISEYSDEDLRED